MIVNIHLKIVELCGENIVYMWNKARDVKKRERKRQNQQVYIGLKRKGTHEKKKSNAQCFWSSTHCTYIFIGFIPSSRVICGRLKGTTTAAHRVKRERTSSDKKKISQNRPDHRLELIGHIHTPTERERRWATTTTGGWKLLKKNLEINKEFHFSFFFYFRHRKLRSKEEMKVG